MGEGRAQSGEPPADRFGSFFENPCGLRVGVDHHRGGASRALIGVHTDGRASQSDGGFREVTLCIVVPVPTAARTTYLFKSSRAVSGINPA